MTYGGPNADVCYSVGLTSDSGFIMTGNTWSFGGDEQVYIIKTNALGDTLWTRCYGGAENDAGFAASQIFNGGYIVAGYTCSFGVYGRDVWLLRLESEIGLSEEEFQSISKKPILATIVAGSLYLPEHKQCRVFDITGRVVEANGMKPGIYFIEVDGIATQKVVKVR
jgi:hypothetical protein